MLQKRETARNPEIEEGGPAADDSRGLFAIKDYREAINQDDFNKAVRKVAEAKKLEGKLEYQKL